METYKPMPWKYSEDGGGTWSEIIPLLIWLLEEGGVESKRAARLELVRMARIADLYT